MMQNLRWIVLLGLGLGGGFFVGNSPAADAVTRDVAPWWQTGSPHAREQERLRTIQPESWTDAKRKQNTYTIPAVTGQCEEAGMLILDLFASADAFHYVTDPAKFQGGLYVTYEVTKPANILLKTGSGSAFWQGENSTTMRSTVFYSSETWDLREPGVGAMLIPFVSWQSYTGNPLAKGVHAVTHGGFQEYTADGAKHIQFIRPPLPQGGAKCGDLMFTVANLTRYTISVCEIASDWQPGGYVGCAVRLTDADGETFDLPGAKVMATVSGDARHEAERIRLLPRGGTYTPGKLDYRYKFCSAYSSNFFQPRRIEIQAAAWILGPDGITREERATNVVTHDQATPVPHEKWENHVRRTDLRTAEGTLIESRALYSHVAYVRWWLSKEKARKMIDAAKRMHVNILGMGIYDGGCSFVRSKIMPTMPCVDQDEDIFGLVVDEAHKAGLQVHPTVNCMNAQGGWGFPSILATHPEWGIGASTNKSKDICDVHRPEFRQCLIRYIGDVAKHYPIDGIKLDYIRTMETCLCEKCRSEYRQQTGRDLARDVICPYTDEFLKWQADAVGMLVKGIREALDKTRPGLKLSTWGHDDPGSPNLQGRRPDVWLNNGWIDCFEIGCYGDQAEPQFYDWLKIAHMVKRPECVWPTFGTYEGMAAPFDAQRHMKMNKKTITGDGIGDGSYARRPKVLLPLYETFRDQGGLNGFAIFDLSNMTEETADEMGRDLFKEPAVPWFPAPGKSSGGRVP